MSMVGRLSEPVLPSVKAGQPTPAILHRGEASRTRSVQRGGRKPGELASCAIVVQPRGSQKVVRKPTLTLRPGNGATSRRIDVALRASSLVRLSPRRYTSVCVRPARSL